MLRCAFGSHWQRWDDANVDLVVVLASTLIATLRRCLAEEHLHEQARTDALTGLINRAELYHRFSELLARYTNRHQVLPGVTGLAQASGFRGETDTIEKLEQRIMQDLAYVRTWSLWLDLKILALTLVRVLTGRNAH